MNKNTSLARMQAAVLASTLFLLAACGSPKIPPAPLQDFKASSSMNRLWSVTLPQALNAAPSYYGDEASGNVLTAYGNEVAAYRANTGGMAWRASLGSVQAPLAASADGRSVLALVQGIEAVSLDAATGEVRWRNALPAEMRTQAASVGGVFVVLTADGRIVAMDEQTGRRRWVLARSLPALSVRGSGAVAALSSSVVAVGLPGGKAVGVNAANGQLAWEVNLAQSRGVNEVERISDVLPDWVQIPGFGLCATSYRQRAACVDSKGQLSYAQEMNAMTGLAASNNQLFALEEDGSVKAWTLKNSPSETTAADWRFDGLKGRTGNTFRSIASLNGAVYAHDNLGYMHVLSSKTGQLIARASTGLSKDAYLLSASNVQGQWLFASAEDTLSAWKALQSE